MLDVLTRIFYFLNSPWIQNFELPLDPKKFTSSYVSRHPLSESTSTSIGFLATRFLDSTISQKYNFLTSRLVKSVHRASNLMTIQRLYSRQGKSITLGKLAARKRKKNRIPTPLLGPGFMLPKRSEVFHYEEKAGKKSSTWPAV